MTERAPAEACVLLHVRVPISQHRERVGLFDAQLHADQLCPQSHPCNPSMVLLLPVPASSGSMASLGTRY